MGSVGAGWPQPTVPGTTYRAVRRARQVAPAPAGRRPTRADARIWWDGRMSFAADATVSEAGEFPLVERLGEVFAQGEQVLVGPGDDAAVLRIRNGHVVVSTDVLVEGRHFRREWASAEDIGHRAAAANLSDINAMGGRAHSLTIGLGAPPDLPAQWTLDFARGFADECAL